MWYIVNGSLAFWQSGFSICTLHRAKFVGDMPMLLRPNEQSSLKSQVNTLCGNPKENGDVLFISSRIAAASQE